MEQRISVITLGVDNLAKATEFYETIIGWKKSPSSPEISFFDLNGLVFALYAHKDLAKETDGLVEPIGSYKGFNLAYNVRTKEEVDTILTSLKAKGVKIEKDPIEQPWGGYSGYFSDIDGHKWEIAFNPYWMLAKDGNVSTTDSM